MSITYYLEALIYVIYSFLAPIITAGGGLLVANVLTFLDISLIKAAALVSVFFFFNGLIVIFAFRKDILWGEVKRFLPLSIVGTIIGAIFLVNVNPIFLLFLMFCFSLYFIYQKVVQKNNSGKVKESTFKEQSISLFSGFLQGTALPGGGFRNAYFLAKGMSLSEMHGTTNFIMVILYIAKIVILLITGVLVMKDFIGILIALPFLIIANILLRRGLIKLPKEAANKITLIAMAVFSIYAAVVILKYFLY
jgi:uncharacterized membrane protein YfcA